MSNDKNRIPENDPLRAKLDGIDKQVRAPAALKQAAKTGVPLRAGKQEGTAVHVRRFGKAVMAYALAVVLVIGVVMFVPRLIDWSDTDPVGCNAPKTNDGTVNEPQNDSAYTFIEEDGKCYLVFTDETNTTDDFMEKIPSLAFASLAEMRDALKNNKLSEEQIETLKHFPKDETNRIQICNVDDLRTVVTPSDMQIDSVSLSANSGGYYSFHLRAVEGKPSTDEAQGVLGSCEYMSETDIKSVFTWSCADFFDRDTITLNSETVVAERNATMYDYSTDAGEFRQIHYTITTEDKTLYVVESYRLSLQDDTDNNRLISDTIPYKIDLYGCDEGAYFTILLTGFTEHPSFEWLSSFGLTEYIESGDTVTQ